MDHQISSTKLEYFDDMWKFYSLSTLISCSLGDDGRQTLILESTIFHPQGGGQPSDLGYIEIPDVPIKFLVEDVRSKDGIVYHYCHFENLDGRRWECRIKPGMVVILHVDKTHRYLSSRLHSAGHLLDISIRNIGLEHLEPGKGYHFSDGPFVEYKGTVPQNEVQSKLEGLENDVNALIAKGGKISAVVLPYEEAAQLCGGQLPEYIQKGSSPRIVKLGENPGCPCGGTHVRDISEIRSMKISQIRTKKGMTKVFYNINA